MLPSSRMKASDPEERVRSRAFAERDVAAA